MLNKIYSFYITVIDTIVLNNIIIVFKQNKFN